MNEKYGLDKKTIEMISKLSKKKLLALGKLGKLKTQKENPPAQSFDLFRLSKSKQVVDISPNTLRAYHDEGLPFYKKGKAVFVSKAELEGFIRRSQQ